MCWYLNVTSFWRKSPDVRWQRFDEDYEDTDLDMEIDDPTLELDVQVEKEERHLLSYTIIRAVADKICNLVKAHGPNAVSI